MSVIAGTGVDDLQCGTTSEFLREQVQVWWLVMLCA